MFILRLACCLAWLRVPAVVWPLYEYDYQCWPRPDWRFMKSRAGRGNMDMMVGSLAWPGSGWLWLGVLGLGAVCALTVVTVSTVQTAITRWSPNTLRLPTTSHSQPPGLTRSCEINAWLAVPYDSCHHSLHCSLSC